MKISRTTARLVRQYVPVFRRSTDEDLRIYWMYAERIHYNEYGRRLGQLAFREMMRRKRREEVAGHGRK